MLRGFNFRSFVVRWLGCLVLMLATYNPYSSSYYHWVAADSGHASLQVLAGLLLLTSHVVVIIATVRSIGIVGIGLVTALFSSAAWVLIDNHVVAVEDARAVVLIQLVVIASVYGVGVSWSHIRNRLSGQVDSTDVAQLSPL
jgi:hypothetical protein